MKNLIELKLVEMSGLPDKILFYVNLPNGPGEIDLSPLEVLPGLERRAGKKTIPATEHKKLFEAVKQIIQANVDLFYIDTQEISRMLDRLETKACINAEQRDTYRRFFDDLMNEKSCLKPKAAISNDVSNLIKTKAKRTDGASVFRVSPNSAFAGPGMFKPPVAENAKEKVATKNLAQSLPTEEPQENSERCIMM